MQEVEQARILRRFASHLLRLTVGPMAALSSVNLDVLGLSSSIANPQCSDEEVREEA